MSSADSTMTQMRDVIRGAYALSRDMHMPTFVYRPATAPPPYVITLDEDTARARCDAEGYTRCDAAEEGEGK